MRRRPFSGRVTPRGARLGSLAAAAAALLVGAGVVWHSAYAGFGDSTAPLLVPVGTAQLTLSDDDKGTRLFSMTGMKPGASSTQCVTVTSTSTAPTVVRLYGTGRSSTNGLSAQLAVTIELGTGGSSASCTGFSRQSTAYSGTLAALPTDTWASGVGSWTPNYGAGVSDSRVYRITCALPTTAPTSAQGGTATITFVWAAQTP